MSGIRGSTKKAKFMDMVIQAQTCSKLQLFEDAELVPNETCALLHDLSVLPLGLRLV